MLRFTCCSWLFNKIRIRYVEGDQWLNSDNERCKKEWFVLVTRWTLFTIRVALSMSTSSNIEIEYKRLGHISE